MMLVLLITVLMVGAVMAFVAGEWSRNVPRLIALVACAIGLLLVVMLWQGTRQSDADGQWLMQYRKAWIPSFGISFHLAVDGLSLLLLALTFFLGILAVLSSWNEIRVRTGFYYFNLLWILAGVAGVFMAMDLFLFYFFWEVMLIPMYFLIGIWGSENRVYAAYKFFIFTQASGLLMFLAIVGLYFIHGRDTGVYTFGYLELTKTVVPFETALWLMSGFMIAFAVKLPVFPFHTWLPDAHGEAPTAGSLILAGLLLKTGAYGMLRFVVPLFPEAVREMAVPAMVLGVAGIVYGAVMAYSQTDLKRLVAFTSVSHMGFVITGIFALNELALQGVVMQLVTHALSTGALFLLAGMIKERLHTRDIEQMGGLWSPMPRMGALGLVFTMASLGLPGLGNFIAEFLILLGVFQAQPWVAVAAVSGLIFSAVYSLRIVSKLFLGPRKSVEPVTDLSFREMLIMAALTVSVVWLGLFPQPVIDTARPAITELIRFMHSQTEASRLQSYVK